MARLPGQARDGWPWGLTRNDQAVCFARRISVPVHSFASLSLKTTGESSVPGFRPAIPYTFCPGCSGYAHSRLIFPHVPRSLAFRGLAWEPGRIDSQTLPCPLSCLLQCLR